MKITKNEMTAIFLAVLIGLVAALTASRLIYNEKKETTRSKLLNQFQAKGGIKL